MEGTIYLQVKQYPLWYNISGTAFGPSLNIFQDLNILPRCIVL